MQKNINPRRYWSCCSG